jgi:hypothetical protein
MSITFTGRGGRRLDHSQHRCTLGQEDARLARLRGEASYGGSDRVLHPLRQRLPNVADAPEAVLQAQGDYSRPWLLQPQAVWDEDDPHGEPDWQLYTIVFKFILFTFSRYLFSHERRV